MKDSLFDGGHLGMLIVWFWEVTLSLCCDESTGVTYEDGTSLPFQRCEFLLHRRRNESQVGLLNHRDTGAGSRRHRQRIDPVDLKQLADAGVAEAVRARVRRDSSLCAAS
jgi:hypothetical protein